MHLNEFKIFQHQDFVKVSSGRADFSSTFSQPGPEISNTG